VVLGSVGPVGCPWFGSVFFSLRGGVSRLRGSASPRCGRVFFCFSIYLALAFGLLSQNIYIYCKELQNLHLPYFRKIGTGFFHCPYCRTFRFLYCKDLSSSPLFYSSRTSYLNLLSFARMKLKGIDRPAQAVNRRMFGLPEKFLRM
jgi:hypothetical protein